MSVVENIAQSISDAVEEEGVMYVVGGAASSLIPVVGHAKVTKLARRDRNNSDREINKISEEDRQKLEGWDYAPNDDMYLKYKEVYDNSDYYNQENGHVNWPPNNGFAGEPRDITLDVGTRIDRYGGPDGGFFSPEGTPYEKRALALHSDVADYYVYEVIKTLEVKGGEVLPWFDRPGGGIQYIKYHPDGSVYKIIELEREGYIIKISVNEVGVDVD